MAVTKSAARTKVRRLMRDENTDDISTAHVDEVMANVLSDVIANEIASVNPSYWLTRRVFKGLTDAVDRAGTVTGGDHKTHERYPLPDDLAEVRFFYRDDLAGQPIIGMIAAEDVGGGRFQGVNQGPISADGASLGTMPSIYSGQGVAIEGDTFRVVPTPQSTSEKFGICYVRRPKLPVGESEIVDIPVEFEVAWYQVAAGTIFQLEGDQQAANILALAWGQGADEGSVARAKRQFRKRFTANMRLGPVRFGR